MHAYNKPREGAIVLMPFAPKACIKTESNRCFYTIKLTSLASNATV